MGINGNITSIIICSFILSHRVQIMNIFTKLNLYLVRIEVFILLVRKDCGMIYDQIVGDPINIKSVYIVTIFMFIIKYIVQLIVSCPTTIHTPYALCTF